MSLPNATVIEAPIEAEPVAAPLIETPPVVTPEQVAVVSPENLARTCRQLGALPGALTAWTRIAELVLPDSIAAKAKTTQGPLGELFGENGSSKFNVECSKFEFRAPGMGFYRLRLT